MREWEARTWSLPMRFRLYILRSHEDAGQLCSTYELGFCLTSRRIKALFVWAFTKLVLIKVNQNSPIERTSVFL